MRTARTSILRRSVKTALLLLALKQHLDLTDEQRSFKRGELYKLLAKKQGAPEGNKNAEKQRTQNESFVFDAETAATDVDVTVEQSTDKPAKKSGIVRSGNMLRTVRPLRTPKTKTFLTEYLQP